MLKNWQLKVREKTVDLYFIKYVVFALLLVIVAALINHILGKFPSIKDLDIYDILAVLAILFAAIQYIDARKQNHEMDKLAKSMSTRYIGIFPKNLIEISEVISKGDSTICVMADFVDYGNYSFPDGFQKYLEKLRDALKRNATVRIICYNKELADRNGEEQFPDESFVKESKSRKFRKYFEINRGVTLPKAAKELRDHLMQQQAIFIDQLTNAGAKIRYFPSPAEFFLWLEDDEEAVFAFKGKEQREFSFRTQDTSLTRQFKDIFESRWSGSDEVYEKSAAATAAAKPVAAGASGAGAGAAGNVPAIIPSTGAASAVVGAGTGSGSKTP